jgi:hypothetical protein
MVNDRLIYAKLLLLKIQKHPLFGINQKFHWPYEGNYQANTVENIILEDAHFYRTWEV